MGIAVFILVFILIFIQQAAKPCAATLHGSVHQSPVAYPASGWGFACHSIAVPINAESTEPAKIAILAAA
jgi:hypothetical protein